MARLSLQSPLPLLCAVALILSLGIAAFLLIPSLTAARTKARETPVTTNTRSIGQAMNIYANDSGDRLPTHPYSAGPIADHFLVPKADTTSPAPSNGVPYSYSSTTFLVPATIPTAATTPATLPTPPIHDNR